MNDPKVVLITGTSSGFGLLTASCLAERGHIVWATMRDLKGQGDLGKELARRNAQATIRFLDVTQSSSIKNVVDEIQQKHKKLDVLVNNAGYGIAGFFEDLTPEEIRSQMETNFFGVQNVCREVIPLMRKQGNGKIINVSSIAGQVASPCLGAYNASKWALEAFSESLYFELGLFGISVVILEPGSYPTNIFTKNAHYAKSFEDAQSPYFSFSQKLKTLARRNIGGLKRSPERVAGLIEQIIDNPRPRMRYISDLPSWLRVVTQKTLPPRITLEIFRRLVHEKR